MKDYVYLVMITSPQKKVMCHKCMYLYATGVYSSRDQLHYKFTLAFKGEGAVQKKHEVWEVLDFLQLVPSPAPPVLYCVDKNSKVPYILKIFKQKQNT